MNQCRKCNNQIPATVRINNKRRNLCGRKFCLECSPFGSHNTKPDDPARKSVYGQERYKKNPYSNWAEHAKESHRKSTVNRAAKLKQKIVNLKGGKCSLCQNSSIDVLTFHHRNREDKLFNLDKSSLRSYSLEEIAKEIEKCDLLCFNCHMETEAKHEAVKGSGKQNVRGWERKQKAIEELGGNCSQCKYDKCIRSLSFHHRDPSTKSFPLDIRAFNGYSWEKLQNEINKCDLLCLNCHRSLENSLRKSRYLQ